MPASASTGIRFRRIDVTNGNQFITADYNSVSNTELCTQITNKDDVRVQTIEHLMAALAGTGVHNALIEIDGPEVPILDGSSQEFVKKILSVGKKALNVPVNGFKVTKSIIVTDGSAWAKFTPAEVLSIEFYIDYSDTVIGRQNLSLSMKNGTFVRELCDSRTFCRESDISSLKSKGFAKGGTLNNAIVLQSDKVQNSEGLRRFDECVRHKMLDAMGDLSLAGGPILAAYSSNLGGHTLTNRLLHAAFSDPEAIVPVQIPENQATQLPGFGLRDADLCNLV